MQVRKFPGKLSQVSQGDMHASHCLLGVATEVEGHSFKHWFLAERKKVNGLSKSVRSQDVQVLAEEQV